MEIGLLKNCFSPKEPANGADGVAKGRLGLFVTGMMAKEDGAALSMLGEDQDDDREQSRQARSRAQHRIGHVSSRRVPVSSRTKTQRMGTRSCPALYQYASLLLSFTA